ncbi:phosphopyruvate hydratase [Kribbella capetownensis]|uniref:Enolase n=1 Tax=Kribbella capetownensis TaxID=1572659 RepID=A0A4V2M7J4_9ACTN|nr:phosphopyruvate hydratase [Kribbella capetownensis]TCC47762.1 phosphopyruvate hydratase [Kribbella capetownensis]
MPERRITGVYAWEAFDSRGNPTVGCEVVLSDGASGSATVPSGASTGSHEAVELRDGGTRYGGRGVATAVANVSGPLAAAVAGIDAGDQRRVDAALREADGTTDLSRLGANAVLGVSLSAAIAHASSIRQPLHAAVAEADDVPLLPMPMVNILSGGAHADGALDIQDVLVVPIGAESFREAIEWAWRVRRSTVEAAEARGLPAHLVADEGGLGLRLGGNRAALELVAEGIDRSGLRSGDEAAIAIDVAASSFAEDGGYRLRTEGRRLTADELVAELAGWVADFPIVSLEDVLGEDDWDGWRLARQGLGGVQLLGDDLFVTNTERLRQGIDEQIANAVLVKPNQVGTLSDALDVVRLAQRSGYRTVLSARSGDTEDHWLADLAVGWRTGQIKVGSTTRSERTAKWNRLLRIEAGPTPTTFATWHHHPLVGGLG